MSEQQTSRPHGFQDNVMVGNHQWKYTKAHTAEGLQGPRIQQRTTTQGTEQPASLLFIWRNFMRPTNLRLRPYAGHLPGRPPTEKHIYLTNGTTDAPMCVKARGNWPRGQIRVRPRHDFLPKDCP